MKKDKNFIAEGKHARKHERVSQSYNEAGLTYYVAIETPEAIYRYKQEQLRHIAGVI